MPAFINLIGQVFGRLTVVAVDRSQGRPKWQCKCECGKVAFVDSGNLRTGNSESCGCRKFGGYVGRPTHGMTGTFEYRVWKGIHDRCRRKTNAVYRHYGGRGIRVCKRWRRFEMFLADMGPSPSSKHSIERKNPNGNYCPSNCFWLIRKKQSRNRRDTIWLTFRGETRALVEWAEHLGLKYQTLRRRHDRGWSDELILTTPVVPYQKVRK